MRSSENLEINSLGTLAKVKNLDETYYKWSLDLKDVEIRILAWPPRELPNI